MSDDWLRRRTPHWARTRALVAGKESGEGGAGGFGVEAPRVGKFEAKKEPSARSAIDSVWGGAGMGERWVGVEVPRLVWRNWQ